MHVAFVAGATGYVGRETVRVLRAREVMTIAHVRPDSPRMQHWMEYFGDLGAGIDATAWELDAMAHTLSRVKPTILFALLGTTRRRASIAKAEGKDAESYERVDFGLTNLLIFAVLAAKIAPRFVYLSAIGASESAWTPYYAARAKAEKALRESGLPHVIARPSIITGADREEQRPMERGAALFADAALGVAARLGFRRTFDRYASMTGAALAEALVRHALDREATAFIAEGADLR